MNLYSAPIEIGPLSRLVRRFDALELKPKLKILQDLQLPQDGQEPNAQFRNFIAALQPLSSPDRTRLAAVWRSVDGSHPQGPAHEGNQFLQPANL